MNEVDVYVHAATRANTRRSYTSAVRHFEVEWGGFLPASADSIARYLARHAELLSIATLRQRLAALSRWHQDHGFADPTKAMLSTLAYSPCEPYGKRVKWRSLSH